MDGCGKQCQWWMDSCKHHKSKVHQQWLTESISTVARRYIPSSRAYIIEHTTDWLTASYKACCVRYGKYGSEAVGGNHNWNERAIQQMVQDLAAPWQELRSMLESSLERDIKFIRDLMDSSIDYAGKMDPLFCMPHCWSICREPASAFFGAGWYPWSDNEITPTSSSGRHWKSQWGFWGRPWVSKEFVKRNNANGDQHT